MEIFTAERAIMSDTFTEEGQKYKSIKYNVY